MTLFTNLILFAATAAAANNPSSSASGACNIDIAANVAYNDSTADAKTDSIPVTQLQELVVKSENRWFENDRLVCIPTRQERNISSSPESLIQAMQIPLLNVRDGSVSDIRGNQVVFYINGVKAEQTDIATFWPKNAIRVEYIPNPSDPKYQGAAAVVNFVMREYKTGGITKVNVSQSYPWMGDYSLSSKLVYKKMTFGAQFFALYSNLGEYVSEGSEELKNIYYDGILHESVKREYTVTDKSKTNFFEVALNARYKGDNFENVHTFSFRSDDNPENSSKYADRWNPDILKSSYSANYDNSRSFSPNLSGYYGGYILPKKFYLMGGWKFIHSRNRQHSLATTGDLDPIRNDISENVNSLQLQLMPQLFLSSKWALSLNMLEMLEWFKTSYAGSSDAVVRQRRSEFNATLRASWQPFDNLMLSLSPSLFVSNYDSDGYSSEAVSPLASFYINWNPLRKLSLSANCHFNYESHNPSATADVTIRTSELMWLQGNPDLKNFKNTSGGIYLTYIPFDMLSASMIANYYNWENMPMSVYSPAPADKGGLIRRLVNSPTEDGGSIGISLSSNFFGNSLKINAYPKISFQRIHGQYAASMNRFNFYGDISYTFRNCNFRISYEAPRKGLGAGMKTFRHPDELRFSFTYGNGNLFVEASVNKIMRKYNWRQEIIDMPFYHSDSKRNHVGRLFSITLSYTFGYGKKVSPDINIERAQSGGSGIISASE